MFDPERADIKAKHGDRTEVFSGITLVGEWGTCTARLEVRTRSGRLLLSENLIVTEEENKSTINGFVISGSEWRVGSYGSGIPRPTRGVPTTYYYDVEVTSSVYGVQTIVEGDIEVYTDVTRPS